MVVWFSPKIMGLSAGIFGIVSEQSGTGFSNCFLLCVLFLHVITGKMYNMLVV